MIKRTLLGVLMLALINSANAHAQKSAGTHAPGSAIGRTGTPRSSGHSPKNSNAMSKQTVDGSDGSATNDGASGQSGAPAPLPVISSGQRATKRSTNRTMKSSTGNAKSTLSGSKSMRQ